MQPTSIIMLGASGAVGGEALKTLLKDPRAEKITLLGRRGIPDMPADRVTQHKVDIFAPESYADLVTGHQVAICTLGVGEPSKISKEEFEKIDKLAVIDFAKACKVAGVQHFELLSSVGIDPTSSNYYLRMKGELVEALKELDFDRLSIFKPSMILTPTNRYGFVQGVALAIWPVLDKLFFGGARKYKGVKVEDLGSAMARNVFQDGVRYEELFWDEFQVELDS
ncbi:NAD(P)H-binding protein [Neolewinella persica]|uniref:NAD(P)H-binding protein n=1 Tax=Neolewinella persica TaxID=70998 RepID=UPI000367E4FA|nr:NAD(P)H-binding protein [Neolewinella persica]